jgi:hypothetical protein
MDTDEGSADGVITNINKNGAFIRCRQPLKLTATCKLNIESPDHPIEDVTAEVVWTNIYGPDDDLTPRGMGVRFTGISEAEQRFLRQLIAGKSNGNGKEYIPEVDLDTISETMH